MRVAFYAPLKPPTHPVPSGDRRMAQLLMTALARAGHTVDLALRFRSYEGSGELERQTRLAGLGGRLAHRLIERFMDVPASERPDLWITYHLYYKAPDWIGPRVAAALKIPFVVVEASLAGKRSGGPWSLGHEATIAALRRANAVISLNPADDAGVRPYLAAGGRLHHLKPFLDPAPFAAAAAARIRHRAALARKYGLPQDAPWLLTVAMMRAGDKLASYRVLGEALMRCREREWRLLVVGDGAAREDVATALAPLGSRVVFAGSCAEPALPPIFAACDLYVWPAINEAYGVAILEAHAAGLPVVAGRTGGVPELVTDGRTGLLAPPGNIEAFADAVRALLDDARRREAFAAAARAKVAAEHDIAAAGLALDAILRPLAGRVR